MLFWNKIILDVKTALLNHYFQQLFFSCVWSWLSFWYLNFSLQRVDQQQMLDHVHSYQVSLLTLTSNVQFVIEALILHEKKIWQKRGKYEKLAFYWENDTATLLDEINEYCHDFYLCLQCLNSSLNSESVIFPSLSLSSFSISASVLAVSMFPSLPSSPTVM